MRENAKNPSLHLSLLDSIVVFTRTEEVLNLLKMKGSLNTKLPSWQDLGETDYF